MKKTHLPTKAETTSIISFDMLYEDISRDWESRARSLQARRWRVIHQAEQGYGHAR